MALAPSCCRLPAVVISVIFLFSRWYTNVDAFVPRRLALPGSCSSASITKKVIMNAAVERRSYITQLSQGALGVLGIGVATDRVEAYEKEYLTEPTPEFKAIEAKQSEFATAQRAYKKEFVKQLDAFLAVNTDDEAVATLNIMARTVMQRGGLPESIRINDLLKTCRKKKAEMKDSGKWGTSVQIAYETLVQVTNKSVIPLQSGS